MLMEMCRTVCTLKISLVKNCEVFVNNVSRWGRLFCCWDVFKSILNNENRRSGKLKCTQWLPGFFWSMYILTWSVILQESTAISEMLHLGAVAVRCTQRLQILEEDDAMVCSYFSGCFGFPLVPPHRSFFLKEVHRIVRMAATRPADLPIQAKPKLQRHKTAQGSAVECLQFHWKPSTCIALMPFAVMKSNWDDFVFLRLNRYSILNKCCPLSSDLPTNSGGTRMEIQRHPSTCRPLIFWVLCMDFMFPWYLEDSEGYLMVRYGMGAFQRPFRLVFAGKMFFAAEGRFWWITVHIPFDTDLQAGRKQARLETIIFVSFRITAHLLCQDHKGCWWVLRPHVRTGFQSSYRSWSSLWKKEKLQQRCHDFYFPEHVSVASRCFMWLPRQGVAKGSRKSFSLHPGSPRPPSHRERCRQERSDQLRVLSCAGFSYVGFQGSCWRVFSWGLELITHRIVEGWWVSQVSKHDLTHPGSVRLYSKDSSFMFMHWSNVFESMQGTNHQWNSAWRTSQTQTFPRRHHADQLRLFTIYSCR